MGVECCGRPMRESAVIGAGALVVLMCGSCRHRRWFADGLEVSHGLAASIAEQNDWYYSGDVQQAVAR